jgi:hypothetical protein
MHRLEQQTHARQAQSLGYVVAAHLGDARQRQEVGRLLLGDREDCLVHRPQVPGQHPDHPDCRRRPAALLHPPRQAPPDTAEAAGWRWLVRAGERIIRA